MKSNKENYYSITISYNGSKFNGYQKQKDKLTVQGELEKVLTKLDKNFVKVIGAGRTDIGVHALSQNANFVLKRNIDAKRLKIILNQQLNKYIYVKECIKVGNDFHSRFDAKEKTYMYKINTGIYDPLLEDYMLQLKSPLNLKNMKKASKCFIGEHDFEQFVSGKRKNYVTIIYKIKFIRKKDIITIRITGKHFYQYMVRNLVGSLIEVGIGKVDKKTLEEMLNNKIQKQLTTAFPQGLYLESIKY